MCLPDWLRRTRRRDGVPARRAAPHRLLTKRSDRVSSAIIDNPPRTRRSWDEAAASADAPVIRVLTLNAHQGFSALRRRNVLSEIRDELRADDAHLVFLQEIGGAEGEEVSAHQYEVLADQVWAQHAYGRNAVTTSGHHGNALLSKYPIVQWHNVDVSIGESEPTWNAALCARRPARAAAARGMRAFRAARIAPAAADRIFAGSDRAHDPELTRRW